jgi:hypothetical protein
VEDVIDITNHDSHEEVILQVMSCAAITDLQVRSVVHARDLDEKHIEEPQGNKFPNMHIHRSLLE